MYYLCSNVYLTHCMYVVLQEQEQEQEQEKEKEKEEEKVSLPTDSAL
jgi:hypothetical protein